MLLTAWSPDASTQTLNGRPLIVAPSPRREGRRASSSTSFTAEVKDFIAPQPISVLNCGYVPVRKTANDTGLGQAGGLVHDQPRAN